MTSLRKSLGDVNTAAQVAVANLEGATGAVEQVRTHDDACMLAYSLCRYCVYRVDKLIRSHYLLSDKPSHSSWYRSVFFYVSQTSLVVKA